jgi:hypothetical protein
MCCRLTPWRRATSATGVVSAAARNSATWSGVNLLARPRRLPLSKTTTSRPNQLIVFTSGGTRHSGPSNPGGRPRDRSSRYSQLPGR